MQLTKRIGLLIVSIWVALDLNSQAAALVNIPPQDIERLQTMARWAWAVPALVLVWLAWSWLAPSRVEAVAERMGHFLSAQRWLTVLYLLLAFLAYPYLAWAYGELLTTVAIRAGLYLLLAWGAWVGFAALFPQDSSTANGSLAVVFVGFGYFVASFVPQVTDYPLSLGWSETSRYYFASLYFSKELFGNDFPVYKDYIRYLIQAVPFLFNAPLIWHRAWQAALLIGMPLLAGFGVARRVKPTSAAVYWGIVFWAALFLAQGPVYFHLLPIFIIVLFGFDLDNPRRTTLAVVVAAVWSGLTRINWLPMAGVIAAFLYLLEKPVAHVRRYFWPPVAWVFLSIGVGVSAQLLFESLAGVPPDFSSTSFTSQLLWDRLLPNVSYPPGILGGAALLFGPALGFGLWGLTQIGRQFHPLRKLAIVGGMLILFVAGLVVSAKIGGGTNLHNLDVFLVLLLPLLLYIYLGRVAGEDGLQPAVKPPVWLFVILLVLPQTYSFVTSPKLAPPRKGETLFILGLVEEQLQPAVEQGEVLFLTQRHLITFGPFADIPMVNDYEKLILMEMAMGNNEEYLGRFQQDLADQRFSMIVIDTVASREKEAGVEPLAEENNVFIERVTSIIKCYYRSQEWFQQINLQLWVPLDTPCQ